MNINPNLYVQIVKFLFAFAEALKYIIFGIVLLVIFKVVPMLPGIIFGLIAIAVFILLSLLKLRMINKALAVLDEMNLYPSLNKVAYDLLDGQIIMITKEDLDGVLFYQDEKLICTFIDTEEFTITEINDGNYAEIYEILQKLELGNIKFYKNDGSAQVTSRVIDQDLL